MAKVIDGVAVKELEVVPDRRGFLMEILKNDDDFFEGFARVYLNVTYPGRIEAWRLHRSRDDNIVCVRGMIKLVLYDDREGSPTRGELQEIFLGEHRPLLVHVPRGLHHGWKCTSERDAYVIGIPTEAYDRRWPDVEKIPHDTEMIPYDWKIKMH